MSSAGAPAASAQEAAEAVLETAPEVVEGSASAAEDTRKKADIVIAPVPFGSPASGFGIAGGVVALYNPNGSPHQWISGGGAAWTTRGTTVIAAGHKMSSPTDAFRLSAAVTYAKDKKNYYGIGEADGDRDDPLSLRNKGFRAALNMAWRVLPNVYAGVRYRLASNDAEPREDPDDPPSATPSPPPDQLESTLSMVGPSLSYDTRDSHTQPREGLQLTAAWLFGRGATGDSYDHDKLSLEGHAYFTLSPRAVLATSAALCAATGEVPYYDLCRFGSSADLRGYTTGRYRDRASWAIQAELRRRFTRRWGGVAFVGVGGIAPSAGGILDESNLLPAAGVGVRYLLFKDNDAHLRLDVALGRDDHGVYLGFGEAF